MTKRWNPRVIGGFVLGALALLAGAILVFGSGQFFRKLDHAVIFFQGSVGGLRVGAPVDLRGVQVGTVQDISIRYDVQSGQSSIPVVIEIDPTRIKTFATAGEESGFSIPRMVERGLRAELRLQSFVTGQMAIQLNFHPRTDVQLRNPDDLPYPEIPAIASTFEQAQEFLTEISHQAPDMLKRLNLVLDRAAAVLGDMSDSSGDVHQAIANVAKFTKALGDSDDHVRNSLAALDTLVAEMNKLAGHADAAAVEFGDTGKRVNRMLADNDGAIKNMIAQFNKAGTSLGQLSERLNQMVQENREGLKDFSSTGLYDLTNLIRDSQELVANLNRTIEDIKRNPSQFLFGQQQREVPAGGQARTR